jgi:hypothetical protein
MLVAALAVTRRSHDSLNDALKELYEGIDLKSTLKIPNI